MYNIRPYLKILGNNRVNLLLSKWFHDNSYLFFRNLWSLIRLHCVLLCFHGKNQFEINRAQSAADLPFPVCLFWRANFWEPWFDEFLQINTPPVSGFLFNIFFQESTVAYSSTLWKRSTQPFTNRTRESKTLIEHVLAFWIFLVLKISTPIRLSNFASILPTRICNSFSSSTFSSWNKKNTI